MRKSITAGLLVLLSSTTVVKGNDFNPDSIIREVSYDYEIISGTIADKSWTDCMGTLYLSIEVPDSTESMVFSRANGPSVKHRYPPFYNTHRPLDISGKSNIDVYAEYVRSDSYFRIRFTMNGTAYYTSHFAINDLISPEDLEILKDLSGCAELEDQDASVEVAGRTLTIKCDSLCNVDVVSVDGKTLFSDTICRDYEIPLQPGIFIVRICQNNTVTTKKIIVR